MLNVNNNEKRTGTHTTKRETQSGKGIKGKGKRKAHRQALLTNIVLYRRCSTI